ncbi:MAG: 2-dehydropantoate 2-reductase [Candidatus Gracilibacteria bacterium]
MEENPSERKILVVGGAVGTFLGAKLHAGGCSVDLLGRGKIAHLGDTIRIQERKYAMPPRLTALPENSSYDLVVLATKLHHLHDILAQIQQARVRAGSLVSIQNGLVDNAQFNNLLGEQRLMVASVFDGFRIDGERLLTTNTGKGWKVEDSPDGQRVS